MERKLLRTDYKDAVFQGLRKYRKVDNGDGTVSFRDVTDYTVKEDSFFGADDVNAINEAVNAIFAELAELGKSERDVTKILSMLCPETGSQMIEEKLISSQSPRAEVIYEAKTDCFVFFSGFAQFLNPTDNVTVAFNILVEQHLGKVEPDGSETPVTSTVTVTANTKKASANVTNIPFDIKLKLKAGEILKVVHAYMGGKGDVFEKFVDMNLIYFFNATASMEGEGDVAELSYERTLGFLNSASEEDIQSGSILTYEEALEILNDDHSEDI